MARILSFINEKGGVGKTSICFNLAWAFAEQGHKVCLLDLDGQRANISFFAGIDKSEDVTTLYDILVDGVDARKGVLGVTDNLHIIPATSNVVDLNRHNASFEAMQQAVATITPYYDYLFIDVSPSPNHGHALALAVSDFVLLPMLAEVTSLAANIGIAQTVQQAKEINPALVVLGIILNRYNWRTNLSKQATAATKKFAESLSTKIFNTKVRTNIAIAECVGQHQGVTTYAPKSKGAADIQELTNEIKREVENYGQ